MDHLLDLGAADQAARMATATLAVHRSFTNDRIGVAVDSIVAPVLGGASSPARWTRYAQAVRAGGQRSSNRRWNVDSAVRAEGRHIAKLADQILAM